MRKVVLFMMTSLDGYFEGTNHDLSWHNVDEEFNGFAAKQLREDAGALLFGRRTYELMESFWPTKPGLEGDPVVAKLMNSMPKIVFSRTLKKVIETEYWINTSLIGRDGKQELEKLKTKKGKDLLVLASSNLCVSLLEWGLLDEVRVMVNPVAIGEGTTLFEGIKDKLKLELTNTRKFKSGNVLLTYKVV